MLSPRLARCDFCGGPEPTLRYPCRSFTTIDQVGRSLDDWLACDVCAELIRAGRWRTLADRALETHPRRDQFARDPALHAALRQRVLTWHQQFRHNRAGDPVPYPTPAGARS